MNEENSDKTTDSEPLPATSCSGVLDQLKKVTEILESHGVQILRIDQAHHQPAIPGNWRDVSGNPVEEQVGYAAKIEILISAEG